MENVIKKILSPKRFEHSMAVAELACEMAEYLGADSEKAYLAGVVHDIAKEKKTDELLTICQTAGVELSEVEIKNPALLHAPAGAALLEEYGIDDEEIKNAVRYHTVARAGMTLLERIIYFADMTEPSRVYKEVEELRAMWRVDFEKAFLTALRYSLIWNLEKGRLVHEGTLRAWNSTLSERNEHV